MCSRVSDKATTTIITTKAAMTPRTNNSTSSLLVMCKSPCMPCACMRCAKQDYVASDQEDLKAEPGCAVFCFDDPHSSNAAVVACDGRHTNALSLIAQMRHHLGGEHLHVPARQLVRQHAELQHGH